MLTASVRQRTDRWAKLRHPTSRCRETPLGTGAPAQAFVSSSVVDQYWHNRTGEDKVDAHPMAVPARASVKRQIMGREVVVAVTNGRLDFGPWEQIFYGEVDGRWRKRVLVKIIGE